MKRENKVMIIIIIMLVVFFLVVFFFLGGSKRIKQEQEQNVIILDSTIWKKSNNRWTNITLDESMDSINWKKYTVYVDGEKLGNYYMWYDEKHWYLFDKDRNAIDYNGEIFAYSSNYDVKISEYSEKSIEDYSYVEEVLKENEINPEEVNYTISKEIKVDVDNDGEQEVFYLASNALSNTEVTTKSFSIVIMVKDNEIYKLYNDIKDDNLDSCKPFIRNFVDIDEDNKYEVIMSCGGYSELGTKDFLYQFTKENKYKIIVSNR